MRRGAVAGALLVLGLQSDSLANSHKKDFWSTGMHIGNINILADGGGREYLVNLGGSIRRTVSRKFNPESGMQDEFGIEYDFFRNNFPGFALDHFIPFYSLGVHGKDLGFYANVGAGLGTLHTLLRPRFVAGLVVKRGVGIRWQLKNNSALYLELELVSGPSRTVSFPYWEVGLEF